MSIEVLYSLEDLPPCDLVGILISESVLNGIVNNRPLRRKPMPFYPLELYANNNRRLRVFTRDGDLNIINLTGATCVFTVKDTKSGPIIIQKSTAVPAEGTIGSPDEGECFFYILPTDTVSLQITQYVYDIRVTLASGSTYTTVEGVLNLQESVG